eukprot:SM000005S17228  [mRNA]  locus=s5:920100:921510:+ [translate_table: standard]
MNDSEVSKQVAQMVQFIRQEAEEKANEISVAAEEEFNIEKLQLVEAEKRKIRAEFERKEKQVDVRKKIDYSTQLNASRLKVLQAQDDIVRHMKEEAEKKLQTVADDSDAYGRLLKGLILQGLDRLSESAVQLRCREVDLKLVQAAVQAAKADYASAKMTEPPSIAVDTTNFLAPSSIGGAGTSCSGGVVMASKDGKIVCINTLDARLDIVYKQNLPAIRKQMFKTSIVT